VSIALRLVLSLPRDASTVPLVRRILDQALSTLGIVEGCRDDIGLILTEACANVIEHARATDDYEIAVQLTDTRCVIEVVNAGMVIDPTRLALVAQPDQLDEHGRGLQIIRSLADELYLTPTTRGGLALRAVATLRWQTRSAVWH
jgi:serine/threonine-protein kinase RsbW